MTGLSWKANGKHRRENMLVTAISLRNTAKQCEIIDLWISGFPAIKLLEYVAETLEESANRTTLP